MCRSKILKLIVPSGLYTPLLSSAIRGHILHLLPSEMPSRPHSPSERSLLLNTQDVPQSYDAMEDESSLPQSPVEFKAPNKVSKGDLAWVLAGLWSAVFLGALDGRERARPYW